MTYIYTCAHHSSTKIESIAGTHFNTCNKQGSVICPSYTAYNISLIFSNNEDIESNNAL